MRLTLRTLLAYLDDILEPADANDLGQKIEESEFASGLVHRIRSVTRKLRLGAPKLSGKGMGLDANTVAEYLDNTLPQERIPDFEKVCLESDVHLAEIASCHQILTLVLGEPADVDPALSESMRMLLARVETEQKELSDHAALPVPPATTTLPPDTSQEVEPPPEYPAPPLIDPRVERRTAASAFPLWPVLATLAATFFLALAILFAMGPLNSDHPVLGFMLPDAASKTETTTGEEELADAGDQRIDQRADDANLDDSPTGGEPADDRSADDRPDSDEPDDGTPSDDEPADTTSLPPLPAVPGPESADAATATIEVDVPPEPLGTDKKLTTGSPPPVGETTGLPSPVVPPMGTDGVLAPGAEAPAEGGEPVAKPEPLAQCLSNLHILAAFDPASETWNRLTVNGPIESERELVALPTYRPQVSFANGIQMMLIGPTAVRLEDPSPEDIPGLVVHQGQILIASDGIADVSLNIKMGDRVSRVTLPAPDAALALEVQRYSQPGTDPEEEPAHWLLQATAVSGQVGWQDLDAPDALLVETGQTIAMVDTAAPRMAPESAVPVWLDGKMIRPIDRDASEHLEPYLELERPLSLSLLEQAKNRLVEVRSLAIRSLISLGNHESFLDAFNSRDYRAFWPDLVAALRASMARRPELAAQTRSMLKRIRGDEGSQLYRMLWGYSSDQLVEGGAAELVEALANPAMDIRVLAYENLYQIAEKTNSYRPEIDPNRQRREILNWQRDLENNQISYKNNPLELSE